MSEPEFSFDWQDESQGRSPTELVTLTRRELEALLERFSGQVPSEGPAPPEQNPVDAITTPAEAAAEPTRPIRDELPRGEDARSRYWHEQYHRLLIERELALALGQQPLLPGAIEQLVKLWRDEFDVVEDQGGTRVVARDGRPLPQSVRERLARSDYAHFRTAKHRGGPSQSGAMTPPISAAGPATLGEAIVKQWASARIGGADQGLIGLGKRRRL